MVKTKLYLAAVIIIMLFFNSLSIAHSDEEESTSFLERAYIEIHWIIFSLVLITCYYSRSVSEKNILGSPKSCNIVPSGNYKGDRIIYQFHRYFFWISIIFIVVFLSSVSLRFPAVFFSTETNLLQKTTKIVEVFAATAFLFYLLGCHHLRYAISRVAEDKDCRNCWKKKLYHKQSRLNGIHDYLFWFSVMAIITLHIFYAFGGYVW